MKRILLLCCVALLCAGGCHSPPQAQIPAASAVAARAEEDAVAADHPSLLHRADLAAAQVRDAAADGYAHFADFVQRIGDSGVVSILLLPVACFFYLIAPRCPL